MAPERLDFWAVAAVLLTMAGLWREWHRARKSRRKRKLGPLFLGDRSIWQPKSDDEAYYQIAVSKPPSHTCQHHQSLIVGPGLPAEGVLFLAHDRESAAAVTRALDTAYWSGRTWSKRVIDEAALEENHLAYDSDRDLVVISIGAVRVIARALGRSDHLGIRELFMYQIERQANWIKYMRTRDEHQDHTLLTSEVKEEDAG